MSASSCLKCVHVCVWARSCIGPTTTGTLGECGPIDVLVASNNPAGVMSPRALICSCKTDPLGRRSARSAISEERSEFLAATAKSARCIVFHT